MASCLFCRIRERYCKNPSLGDVGIDYSLLISFVYILKYERKVLASKFLYFCVEILLDTYGFELKPCSGLGFVDALQSVRVFESIPWIEELYICV